MSNFISRWNTANISTGSSNSNQVRLPLIPTGTYNFTVSWGDNTTDTITSWDQLQRTHTYFIPGNYTINITGTIIGWSFDGGGDRLKLLNITNWGTLRLSGNVTVYYEDFPTIPLPPTFGHFRGCSNLTNLPSSGLDMTGTIDFTYSFTDCSSLTSFPLINTSGVFSFNFAWENCSSLTSFPLINTNNAEDLHSTWRNCSNLTSFPLINTSNVINFIRTWENCNKLTSFPLINTSNAEDLNSTWKDCTSLTSFPLIDTSNVTNFLLSFNNCINLTSFPLIDTSKATYLNSTWENCSSLTSFPLIDTSSVNLTLSATWRDCQSLTSFPLIDTSNVTYFTFTWEGCQGFLSFPLIDTSSAIDLTATWRDCINLSSFPSINTSNVVDFEYTWKNTGFFVFPSISLLNAEKLEGTWEDCTNLSNFPLLDFSNVENFNGTWRTCVNLNNLPVGFGSTMDRMTSASQIFTNTNLTVETYSRLLIEIESVNSNNDVVFDGGNNNNYNTSGGIARNRLINDRNWIITDGGLIPDATGVILNGVALISKENFDIKPIFPLQIVPSPSITISNIFDVSKNTTTTIFCNFSNNIENSIGPIIFQVQTECDDKWISLVSWEPSKSPTIVSSIVTSNNTNISITTASSLRKSGQLAFIYHRINASPLDLSKSEFVKIQQVSGTNIALVDQMQYNHMPNINEIAYLYSTAYNWMVHVDVSSLTKLRFLLDASQSNQQFVFESYLVLD